MEELNKKFANKFFKFKNADDEIMYLFFQDAKNGKEMNSLKFFFEDNKLTFLRTAHVIHKKNLKEITREEFIKTLKDVSEKILEPFVKIKVDL